jgi:hypothetical protein
MCPSKQKLNLSISLSVIAAAACLSFSCETRSNNKQEAENAASIEWKYIENASVYEDAILNMMLPYDEDRLYQQAEFIFEAVNFQFNTSSGKEFDGFKSFQGSHIQLLLNGKVYGPVHEREKTFNLADGQYISLACLCNDKGMISRSPEAYVIRQFIMGDGNFESKDLTKPMIFCHLPGGKYEEKQEVLLDFFVANTTLKPDGNKVRVSLQNETFIIDQWQPISLSGLAIGDYTIQLELTDASGKTLPGKYSTATGQFTIEKSKNPI